MKSQTAAQINAPLTGQLDIATREPQHLGVQRQEDYSTESLIRLALDKGVSITELVALRNQERAAQAKRSYDNALAAFQSECPIILKTSEGYNRMYKYAKLPHIIATVKDLLCKHGFSYSINSVIKDKCVKAEVKITHSQPPEFGPSGHFEVSDFDCPIDDNPKNAMSTPQRYGAAMTFAKRYAFCNGFGILTADVDSDAQGQKSKPKGPGKKTDDEGAPLREKLWRILVSVRKPGEKTFATIEAWLFKHNILAGGKTIATLTAEELKVVIEKTEIQLGEQ